MSSGRNNNNNNKSQADDSPPSSLLLHQPSYKIDLAAAVASVSQQRSAPLALATPSPPPHGDGADYDAVATNAAARHPPSAPARTTTAADTAAAAHPVTTATTSTTTTTTTTSSSSGGGGGRQQYGPGPATGRGSGGGSGSRGGSSVGGSVGGSPSPGGGASMVPGSPATSQLGGSLPASAAADAGSSVVSATASTSVSAGGGAGGDWDEKLEFMERAAKVAGMSDASLESADLADVGFWASTSTIHSVRCALNILPCRKKSTTGTIEATNRGLKFTVEDSHSYAANVYLTREMFNEYYLGPNATDNTRIEVTIDFNSLMESLNLFVLNQSHSALWTLLYVTGRSVYMCVEPAQTTGIETSACFQFRILNATNEDRLPSHFIPGDQLNSFVVTGTVFRDAILEMDPTCDHIMLNLTPIPPSPAPSTPFCQLISESPSGTFAVEFSKEKLNNESATIVQTQNNRYKMSQMKALVGALKEAETVMVSTNHNGLLSLQISLQSEDRKFIFVDFHLLPDFSDPADTVGGDSDSDS
ncbi:cell cycle checkpoint protein [Pelomyxa schiedti]|nr:cell cycle checkpoint protein [Pelomyxa schiedti]